VGNGEVTLNNVVVTGTTIVRGGGVNSIRIIGNSNVKNIVVTRVNGEVRVFAEDGTEVGTVIVDGKDDVIIEGKVKDVKVEASDITVTANNATIDSLTMNGAQSQIIANKNVTIKNVIVNAKDNKIVAEKGSTIKKVEANQDGAKISGSGTVTAVNANANNIVVKTSGTSVAAAKGTTGVVIAMVLTMVMPMSAFALEPSTALDAANITVTNNNGDTKDTVKVTGLAAGDVVNVYDAATEGTKLGAGTVAAEATEVTIELAADLGDGAGSIFATVTNDGKAESARTEKAYAAEAADKAALNAAIAAAKAKHDAATEGTSIGQYAVDSKATFQTAIDAATAVNNNTTATQRQVDDAVTALDTAGSTFQAAMVGHYVSDIDKANVLLVGRYAFDLNDEANNNYSLDAFIRAAQTAFFNGEKYEIYYSILVGEELKWVELVSGDMDTFVNVENINDDGLYKDINVVPQMLR